MFASGIAPSTFMLVDNLLLTFFFFDQCSSEKNKNPQTPTSLCTEVHRPLQETVWSVSAFTLWLKKNPKFAYSDKLLNKKTTEILCQQQKT